MATSEMTILFKISQANMVLIKPIKRVFSQSNLVLETKFFVGMTTNTQAKKMYRDLLPGGLQFTINFRSNNLPVNTVIKKVERKFSRSDENLNIGFKINTVKDTSVKNIWRFVKWTLGGPFNEKYYTIRTIEKPFITVDPLPILPQLRGQAYPDKKRLEYNTIIKKSPSDIAKTYETWHYPRWYIELIYEFLEGNAEGSDYQKLLNFFTARRGNLEDFWFKDPDDNYVKDELIGNGDGNTKSYQLCRTYCGNKEPIFAVDKNYEFELKINGIKQLNNSFTITNTGLINFKIVPDNGSVITASFHFFYRCRFTEDISEFENFAYKLWNLKSLSMVTTL